MQRDISEKKKQKPHPAVGGKGERRRNKGEFRIRIRRSELAGLKRGREAGEEVKVQIYQSRTGV